MKRSWLHRTIAFLFAVVITFPFLVQGIHAFEKHERTICLAEAEQHFHESDFDCSLYHITIEHESDLFKSTHSFYNWESFKNPTNSISEFIPSRIYYTNLTRGPPKGPYLKSI